MISVHSELGVSAFAKTPANLDDVYDWCLIYTLHYDNLLQFVPGCNELLRNNLRKHAEGRRRCT